MYTNQRETYRQTFFDVWQAYQQAPHTAIGVNAQLIAIMLAHPEYHALLNQPATYQQQTFSLEENPFFHMSLHLAIKDQIQLDRPTGVASMYHALIKHHVDVHEVEHQMMTCLAQVMWAAQEQGTPPNEADYLNKLKALL